MDIQDREDMANEPMEVIIRNLIFLAGLLKGSCLTIEYLAEIFGTTSGILRHFRLEWEKMESNERVREWQGIWLL